MIIYAEIGTNRQQFGGECPNGWVKATGARPSTEHTVSIDGTWLEGVTIVNVESIDAELISLNSGMIRPQNSILASQLRGDAIDEEDKTKLLQLQDRAEELRAQRASL